MKKLFAIVLVLALILGLGSVSSLNDQVFAEEKEAFLLYAKVPDTWENPAVWAFAEDGTAAFDAWPGFPLIKDSENPGYFYAFLPNMVDKVIVSANEGAVQTSDLAVEKKNLWINVSEDGTGKVSYTKETKGDLPVYEKMMTVKAFVPKDWEMVNYWAWSHPDGTNAFPNWPGSEAKLESDGWYSLLVPAFVNRIIVNANLGEVQTGDLEIDQSAFSDKFIPTVYVVVDKEGEPKAMGGTVSYGEKPDVTPKVKVHAKIPEDWALPCLWAWSHPDGTNAFANWPGEEMIEGEGWYTMDAADFINKVIISGNLGDVQTVDIDVEAKEMYITIEKANEEGKFTASVSYEMPKESSSSSVLIAVLISVAVVAVLVVIILANKKKKKENA